MQKRWACERDVQAAIKGAASSADASLGGQPNKYWANGSATFSDKKVLMGFMLGKELLCL